MEPVFAAFDRDVYQHIIPTHLADLMIIPSEILNKLKGRWVHCACNLWGMESCSPWWMSRNVYKQRLQGSNHLFHRKLFTKKSLIFNYRINLCIFFSQGQKNNDKRNYKQGFWSWKTEESIVAMAWTITEYHLFPENMNSNRGLVNVFTRQQATPEEVHNLQNFRSIGNESTEVFIKHQIIGTSSTSATI